MGIRPGVDEIGFAVVRAMVLAGAALAGTGESLGQATSKVPDAQVESNVLKALASSPKLATEQISTTSVYGVVTLSGQVRDEATRTQAEDLVSRTAGVTKVVDELTIGSGNGTGQSAAGAAQLPPSGDPGSSAQTQGTNPQLQSDGTYASPDGQPREAPTPPNAGQQPGYDVPQASQQPRAGTPVQRSGGGYQGYPAYGAGQTPYGQPNQPEATQPGQAPYSQQPSGQPAYGQQQGAQPPYGQPSGPPPYPQGQAPYGPPAQYGQPGQAPYGPPRSGPYGQADGRYQGQLGGQPVSVAAGAMLQIRMSQGLDSKHVQPGTTFSGTVVRDVIAGNMVAIPRGALVQGTVVDVTQGGALKGRATLALQLNQVTLGARIYPLASNVWTADGRGTTGRTVNNAVGLGVVGAIIGGVAGGGAGAAIGAGAGAATGVGVSAAQGSSPAFLPPESVLTFQLTSPVELTTVSQAEMERLGYGVPNGAPVMMVRRYPTPYYYYGSGYYYGPRVYYRRYPY